MSASGDRRSLPRRVRSMLGAALLTLPDPVLEGMFSGVIGYGRGDVPAAIPAPAAARRLLIAPANYAGQGFAWARAAETLPDVGARNLFVSSAGGFAFAADARVSNEVFQKSHRWGREQARAVRDGFTHMLVEAERPILGRFAHGDPRREHAFLRNMGLAVAYVGHGSDLRLPSRHADLDPWSPFRDRDWELLPVLERVAAQNAALLDDLGEREYVATPELMRDRPGAVWLPNCVDAAHWRVDAPVLEGRRPRVVHAPTNARIKGSDLIQPALDRLVAGGVVDYARVGRVAPSDMPAVYASADVVLEQFRLGAYGTTGLEAMAAGRVVIGHVGADVREIVEERAGMPLPIVEATPDTLEEVLADVAARPEHYVSLAAAGPAFVAATHSGGAAAGALQAFLDEVP